MSAAGENQRRSSTGLTAAAAGFVFLLILSVSVCSSGQVKSVPRVAATSPVNNAADVDPSLREISVTFSEPMQDKSWSWAFEDRATFPEVVGHPSFTSDFRTCLLPVKLEPGKEYVIWINTGNLKNFKSASGVPAEPYMLRFNTRK